MKNWILWLVVSLIFIGGATTFFILWYKEKKKNAPNGGKTIGSTEIPSGVAPPEQVAVQTENVTTEVNGSGRSVGQVVPLSFGRTAN